jgi:hypothetical protein
MPDLLPDYESSVGAVVNALHSHSGRENGDPAKVAQAADHQVQEQSRTIQS